MADPTGTESPRSHLRIRRHAGSAIARLRESPAWEQSRGLWRENRWFRLGGVDIGGLFSAVVDYASKMGTGRRAKGGSTITQQVAKNILIGNEYSVTRKLKEMILARRIEHVLSKPQILELYLNEIPLGRQ